MRTAAAPSPDHVARLKIIYDHYRTFRLNQLYYGERLDQYRKYNKAVEIALIVGTSGSVGGWAIFQGGVGSKVWGLVSGIACLLAVLQPVLKLKDGIERYSKLHTGHADVYYDLHRIVLDISANRELTESMYARFESVMERFTNLVKDDDPKPNEALLTRCEEAVKKEIPAHSLWMP